MWCDDLGSEWAAWASRMVCDGRLVSLPKVARFDWARPALDGIGIYTCLGSACGQPAGATLLVADSQARSFHGSAVQPPVPAQGAPPASWRAPQSCAPGPMAAAVPKVVAGPPPRVHPHTPFAVHNS